MLLILRILFPSPFLLLFSVSLSYSHLFLSVYSFVILLLFLFSFFTSCFLTFSFFKLLSPSVFYFLLFLSWISVPSHSLTCRPVCSCFTPPVSVLEHLLMLCCMCVHTLPPHSSPFLLPRCDSPFKTLSQKPR
jgi:hypothetical protein